MDNKDSLGDHGGTHNELSSENPSDEDLDVCSVDGNLTTPLEVEVERMEHPPIYICSICLQQPQGEVASPDVCQHTFCLQHILQWAKVVTACPVDRRPFSALVVRRWPAGPVVGSVSVPAVRPAAAVSAACSAAADPPVPPADTAADVIASVPELNASPAGGLDSGTSGDDSDWEGAGGAVLHRRRVSRTRAISRLKQRAARPPFASYLRLVRSRADRAPPPPPPPPLLRAAGVQPAGGAAGSRATPPPGAPAAHEGATQRAADGCAGHLPGVANGEMAGGVTGALGVESTDGGDGAGGRPSGLKTVIDDGLKGSDRTDEEEEEEGGDRADLERTGDGLEDVSADEGVEDDRTSPDSLRALTEPAAGGEQNADAVTQYAASGGDRASPERAGDGLEDVSADEAVKDDRTSPDSPHALAEPAAGDEQSADAAGDGRHASLDDVSEEETPVDNGISHELVSNAGDGSERDENGAHDSPERAEVEHNSPCETEKPADDPVEEDPAGVSVAAEPSPASAEHKAESPDAVVEASVAHAEDESSDTDSKERAAVADAEEPAAAEVEDADVDTDVEDELADADVLQDRIDIDSSRQIIDPSFNQRHTETGAGKCQTLPGKDHTDPVNAAVDSERVTGGPDSVSAEDSSSNSHKGGDHDGSQSAVVPDYERISDSLDDEPKTASATRRASQEDVDLYSDIDEAEPGSTTAAGRAAADPLASPVYSPVMSPSIHSLDSVPSPERAPAAVAGETPGGHCALGVADASDVSSDEELVRGESGRPAAGPAADGRPGAGSWQLLPVESISSPESFGPDQEEPEPEPEREPEPEVAAAESEPAPAQVEAVVPAEAAAAPALAPAPLLCLGTEQISDNEEDGFDDGMEEGEIPSERPPTPPPPPAPAPVAVPLPLPAPLLDPDPERTLNEGDVSADADAPDGDFEEGEIPSELPPVPAEPPERAEEAPVVVPDSPPRPPAPPPMSPVDPTLPEGDYEEGEIVEERSASADEPGEAVIEPSPPAPPRPSSGADEPPDAPLGDEPAPSVRVAPAAVGLQAVTIDDDDDAPDVDEEVRDFVVHEKTITGLEQDDGDDVGWKKFSRSARERNYRDGKPADRAVARSKEVAEPRLESKRSPPVENRRGKKRDIQRYDVRKVITERKLRAQENQERGGHARRSRSSSSSGSRSSRRVGQRWRRSRSPSRSRSRSRRRRDHRRRSRDKHSPPRRDRSRHSVSRHSPSRHSPSRHSHSRHSHSRHSLSRSPPHKRTISPVKKAKDRSKDRKRKRSSSPVLASKKLKKRKDKPKKKDEKKKKKKRAKSPVSKAVIVDGDNLVVSVNFTSKDHRDRLGTKSRVVRHEEREPSLEYSPVRERPARLRDLPTPSKDKRLPVRERDRDLPRRDRDRDERAKPSRASRAEREPSTDRLRRDARKENKDPKQSARGERKRDSSARRSPSPSPPPARGSKRPRSVTPPRERRSPSPRPRALSPRARALSPRSTPRGRAPSPRTRVQSPRGRALSPRARTPSPRSRALSPRPRALSPRARALSPRPRAVSPRARAASPRARSPSRSSDRPRKYARRSRSGSRSSSWSRSSASSSSPEPSQRRSGSAPRRRPRRSPDLIDLDVIELSPKRDEPIVITDSETEAEPAARPVASRAAAAARPPPAAPAETAAPAPRAAARSPRGPKTPPEPAAAEPTVKFSLSAKLAAVRMINNPLREEADDELDAAPAPAATKPAAAPAVTATTQPAPAAPRGPSTPPEPPPSDASEAKFGDQYDPFEPTHSGSATPDSPPSPDGLASPEPDDSPAPEPPAPAAAEPAPPPLPAEQLDRPTEKPPEPRHTAEAEKRPASHTPQATQPVASLFAGLPPPSAVSLLSSVLSSVLPDTSRPPPSAPAAAPAPAAAAASQAAAAAAASAPAAAQNGQRGSADVVDMDLDSPYSPDSPNSPDSREGDDLFEPPRATRAPAAAAAGRSRRMDPKDRFEAMFGTTHGRGKAPPGKPVPAKTPAGKLASKRAQGRGGRSSKRSGGKGAAAHSAGEADDGLKVVDDVPNSAVEMQFLKKLNRQERVIEEVKLVLKPFYHKRTITKEQYKETLRKSVPKICHSKSGEINPKKIHSLIISYVKKCKYINKKNHVTVPNPNVSTPVKGKV